MVTIEPDAATTAGGRTFDVSGEGTMALTTIDPVVIARGAATTATVSFDIGVTDGALDVATVSRVGEPVVAAIYVVHLSDDPDGFDRIDFPADSATYAPAVRGG